MKSTIIAMICCMLPAVRFAATDVTQSTVNFLVAAGMVTDCRDSVAYVALPFTVISN